MFEGKKFTLLPSLFLIMLGHVVKWVFFVCLRILICQWLSPMLTTKDVFMSLKLHNLKRLLMFLCKCFSKVWDREREFQPNFCKHCCVCVSVADLENVTNFSIFCVFTLVSGDVHCAMCKLDSVHFCRFSLWKTASQTGFKEERRESVWHWLLWLWTLCIRWRGQPGAVSAGNF